MLPISLPILIPCRECILADLIFEKNHVRFPFTHLSFLDIFSTGDRKIVQIIIMTSDIHSTLAVYLGLSLFSATLDLRSSMGLLFQWLRRQIEIENVSTGQALKRSYPFKGLVARAEDFN